MSVKVGLITGHPLFKYYSIVAAMPPRDFVGRHQAAALWRVWANALLCATQVPLEQQHVSKTICQTLSAGILSTISGEPIDGYESFAVAVSLE